MKKLISLITGWWLLGQNAAHSQAWDGPGQQAIIFNTHQLGDGSDSRGGTPPAFARQPAKIASNFNVQRYLTASGVDFERAGGSYERKFRFLCDVGPLTMNDFILSPNVTPGPHLHQKFGNIEWDHTTVHSDLRAKGDSTCHGGPINRSAYWIPALKDPRPSGAQIARRFSYVNIYYNLGADPTAGRKTQPLPRGLQFIAGFNPADPTDSRHENAIAASNAIYGNNMQYRDATPNGVVGWSCQSINGSVQGTANGAHADDPDGNGKQNSLSKDGVNPTMICPANGIMILDLISPSCWDGKNLTSPDGRRHMLQFTRDNNGDDKRCPDGWVRLLEIEWKFVFPIGEDPAHIAKLYFSSDRMDPNPAKWFKNGSTAHTDFAYGWDSDILETIQVQCLGITIGAKTGVGADCDNGTISPTQRLVTGSVDTTVESGNAIFQANPAGKDSEESGHAHGLLSTRQEAEPDEDGLIVGGLIVLVMLSSGLALLRRRDEA